MYLFYCRDINSINFLTVALGVMVQFIGGVESVEPILERVPYIGVDLAYPSKAPCEDNLDPQLDQCNEEVIRVALLTFGLKR